MSSCDAWRDASSLKSGVAAGGGGPTRAREPRSSEDIEGWLLQRLQARLGDGAEVVDRHMPFSYYGLDSIDAVELAAELEDWLRQPPSRTLPFRHTTA